MPVGPGYDLKHRSQADSLRRSYRRVAPVRWALMENVPKIISVEPIPVSVSGARDFAISEGRTRIHTSVILRLRTEDDDLEGIAEIVCAPPGKPEELPDEIVGAVNTIVAPALVGIAATDRALGRADGDPRSGENGRQDLRRRPEPGQPARASQI